MEHDAIRRPLYPQRGDTVTGDTKTTAYKNLAVKLFEGTIFAPWISSDPAALTFYANSVKNRIAKHEVAFKEAKIILGVTAGGLDREEDIWTGPEGEHLQGK